MGIKENIKKSPKLTVSHKPTVGSTQKCLWAEIPGFDIKTDYELRNNRWAPSNQRISGRPAKMQNACQCAEACTKNCFLKGALQRRRFRPRQDFVFGKKLN